MEEDWYPNYITDLRDPKGVVISVIAVLIITVIAIIGSYFSEKQDERDRKDCCHQYQTFVSKRIEGIITKVSVDANEKGKFPLVIIKHNNGLQEDLKVDNWEDIDNFMYKLDVRDSIHKDAGSNLVRFRYNISYPTLEFGVRYRCQCN